MKSMYDYLIVGAGLYGAVFAQEAKRAGKSVLVIDKRPHIAGNVYTEKVEGINVHKYGAHIFHTNNKKVWDYITRFATFNRFTNSPVANYHGELYSLPFNMYTFNRMWGVVTPEEAAAKIEEQRQAAGITEPSNLEEQAISLVGTDIYEKLIKGYTEKQWGRPCTELPAFIIKRLPVRLTFDNNYFNALYQGIPVGGYTKMVANLLDGIEVRLNEDYLEKKEQYDDEYDDDEYEYDDVPRFRPARIILGILSLLGFGYLMYRGFTLGLSSTSSDGSATSGMVYVILALCMLVSALLYFIMVNRYTIFAFLAPMLFYLASAGFAFLKRGSELELLIVAGVSAAFAVISLILGIASRGGDYYYEDDDEDEDYEDPFEDEHDN